MQPNRKAWNERHKQLRVALEKTGNRKDATKLFLNQHAAVHSTTLSRLRVHSFEDEILKDLSAKEWRFIPHKGNHSIAWIIWHLARVEDITINLLISGSDQILHTGSWLERLRIKFVHTGNGMTDNDVITLSNAINIKALVEYRLAVGRQTRKSVLRLNAINYRLGVDPEHVLRIWKEHAVLPIAKGIVNYWASRTIAGLLLMPPTRHCFLHLNEARRIKTKLATHRKT